MTLMSDSEVGFFLSMHTGLGLAVELRNPDLG